ncbi:response regulator [Cypionkella sp. TWP1-2-1b2]|uniref:response regulator n=1 Tax=Cypionkella sp. TWP1-2-1b2 TaxID=2804675 RepID=UPI003CEFD055
MDDSVGHQARVLIVDDEPLIAMDLEYMLVEAGFIIAGVTGNLQRALSLVESGICDAAVLDANLNGLSAAPIAVALVARGLPFLVLSGYAPEQQHEALRAGRCLQKPADPVRVIKVLNQILSENKLRPDLGPFPQMV